MEQRPLGSRAGLPGAGGCGDGIDSVALQRGAQVDGLPSPRGRVRRGERTEPNGGVSRGDEGLVILADGVEPQGQVMRQPGDRRRVNRCAAEFVTERSAGADGGETRQREAGIRQVLGQLDVEVGVPFLLSSVQT